MDKKLKVAVFYYDGFAEFETCVALLLLQEFEIVAIALEKRIYVSGEKQRFHVDYSLDELDPLSVDLLIVPGGDSSPLYNHEKIKSFVNAILDNGKTVSGICGGATLLGSIGVLEGKCCTGETSGVQPTDAEYVHYESAKLSDAHVVVDDNLITAHGQAFLEFAVTLAKHMGVIKEDPEKYETLNWLKDLRGEAAAVNWLTPSNGWIDVSESVKVSKSAFEECNMTLIASEGEALLVDTGYEKPEAERVLDYLQKFDIKLKHIVITHHHEDHDANLALFHMNQGDVYDATNIEEGMSLTIGNKSVKLMHTPGHFPAGDISALVVDENILISGDILYACLPPQLCYGANPEVLIKTLKVIEQAHYKWIIPGHGKVLTGKLMMSMALNYIDTLYESLNRILSTGGTLTEAARIDLADCIMYREWMVDEPALDLHRQNIEEIFETLKEQHIRQ